jgi:uncharacterized membrane protein
MTINAFGWIMGAGAILGSIGLAVSSLYDAFRRARRHA